MDRAKLEAEFKAFEKTFQDKRTAKRFRCVYLRIFEHKTAVAVAEAVGYHLRHVQRIWAEYDQGGLEALRPQYQGGNNRLLSLEEEAAILSQHEQTVGIAPILEAISSAVGRPVSNKTVYPLLKRHGWKAKRPRPRHPQADPEAQCLFKKTTRRLKKDYKNNQ